MSLVGRIFKEEKQMGTFNVKNFFGSMFTPVEDDVEENYYGEEEGYYEEEAYEQEPIAEESYVEEPRTFVQEPAVTTPVMQKNATVIMLTPYDIRTSQIVCDHIREGHIVICNLTNTDKNQRVVDYISGGVYALGGRVEPTPVKTTFVCTPKSVDLVVENQDIEQVGTKVSAL
jgi:FtsZ-interacting cell division protein YlmF